MLTDLVQIRRLGEHKRGENERFRKHLKRHSFVKRKFRRLAQTVEEQIDCTECANCCRVATVRLSDRDVQKLAKFLRVPVAEFVRNYTEQSPDEGLILRRTDESGCIFLNRNLCGVYDARPHICDNFPHLIRGDGSLLSRMWDFNDRACYCPIVYNTLEEFKEEVKFR